MTDDAPAFKLLQERLVEDRIEIPAWVESIEIDEEGYPWAYDDGGHYKSGLPAGVKRICKELFAHVPLTLEECGSFLIESDQLEVLRAAVRKVPPRDE